MFFFWVSDEHYRAGYTLNGIDVALVAYRRTGNYWMILTAPSIGQDLIDEGYPRAHSLAAGIERLHSVVRDKEARGIWK